MELIQTENMRCYLFFFKMVRLPKRQVQGDCICPTTDVQASKKSKDGNNKKDGTEINV